MPRSYQDMHVLKKSYQEAQDGKKTPVKNCVQALFIPGDVTQEK